MGFLCSSVGKESACSTEDSGSIPGLGRSPGEGNGNPTPVSLPGKSHGAWWGPVHGVAKSQTWLSNFFTSNNWEGTQPHPSAENWIKDLLWVAPPIRTRPNFPLSQSLPSRSFHKPLILLHQRADRLKTTITEN